MQSEAKIINPTPGRVINGLSQEFVVKLTEIEEKSTILKNWYNYIDDNLMDLMGPTPEGNIYSIHRTNTRNELMVPKQKNIIEALYQLSPKTMLEIGFNGGFSALLAKMTVPNLELTCVDINEHFYVEPCYQRISQDYPGINLILESSLTAVPNLIGATFDVIHVDGDHRIEGARKDFENVLKVSHPGTIIIFDDTNLAPLNVLCDEFVRKNVVEEFVFDKIPGTRYEHRFLRVIN